MVDRDVPSLRFFDLSSSGPLLPPGDHITLHATGQDVALLTRIERAVRKLDASLKGQLGIKVSCSTPA